MQNNVSIPKSKAPKRLAFSNIDGLIKFILAGMLISLSFVFQKGISIGMLSVFLFAVTLLSKMKWKTLFYSGASYAIIVLIPYLFGILMNSLFYTFSGNEIFALQQGPFEIFLRLFRLFVIWYVSILYFHTTPTETVIGLLDKLLTPLKFIGIPVEDYLKVVMCIIIELTETGVEVKKSLAESMRSVMGESKRKFRINIKGVSQIIVSLIVNSFEKIDKIQNFVEKAKSDDLYFYRFQLSKSDGVAVLSFVLFTAVVWMLEKGYWV